MENTNLFFYSFFDRLRKSAGIQLDLTQYYLFLELFIKGHVKSKEALRNLCKALWLMERRYEAAFDVLFDEAFDQELPLIDSEAFDQSDIGQTHAYKSPEQSVGGDDFTPSLLPQKDPKPERHREELPEDPPTSNLLEVFLNFEEATNQGVSVKSPKSEHYSVKRSDYTYSDDKHLPISPRRAQRLLTKLRLTQMTLAGSELDIQGLVNQRAQEKFIHKILYTQQSVSVQNVILLADHLRNMTAFETWEGFLYDLLSSAPNIETIQRFYFYSFPIIDEEKQEFIFFKNKNHTTPQNFGQLLNKINRKSTLVLIFSDAGTYHSAIDFEYVQKWKLFLDVLESKKILTLWLNPLPRHRWEQSSNTASLMSQLVKMFPFDQNGFAEAIKHANYAITH